MLGTIVASALLLADAPSFTQCCETEFPIPIGSAPRALTAGPDRALSYTSANLNEIGRFRIEKTDRDFNSDGSSDILWRDTSGTVGVWRIEGMGVVRGATNLGTIESDWTIAGSGDFNADGTADILWRHSDGTVAI
jgi:hypothetical protein